MARTGRRAVVIGGSLGGLTTALLLAEAGFAVSVNERATELADRGAGIVAHPESLRYLLDRGIVELNDISIPCGDLRYLDRDGVMVHAAPVGYRFTSWVALYSRLLDRLSPESMHFGRALLDFRDHGDAVVVRLEGDIEEVCNVLVCADGISSTARRLLVPAAQPAYSGYIGWRGIVPLDTVDVSVRASLGTNITYQLLDDGHVLAYPIPDSQGGRRGPGASLNWVWYQRLPAGLGLTQAMTDRWGREHALSVPPGWVDDQVLGALRAEASTILAGDLSALVLGTGEPFIQRVVDVEVDQMAFGRVCLLGDAAFVARPHAAAGTAKAAADAWALGAELGSADDVATGLLRWQPGQLDLGHNLVRRSRDLGDSQFQGTWVAGDASLLFGLRAPGDSCFDVSAAPNGGVAARG